MEFSSTRLMSCVSALAAELSCVQPSALSGADAALLVERLVPVSNQLAFVVSQLGARAVTSGTRRCSWLASATGSTQRQAQSSVGLSSALSGLPALRSGLESGAISAQSAEVIVRAADGDSGIASALVDEAASGLGLDGLRRSAQRLATENQSASKRQRLCRSQYFSAKSDADSMITGSFRLLPELGARLLSVQHQVSADTSWERAEAIAGLLGLGSSGSGSAGGASSKSGTGAGSSPAVQVVAHIDLEVSGSGELSMGTRCEIAGVGPVAISSVAEFFETASLSLVGTVNNKLAWFSEHDKRSASAPLPQFIRRAIKARDWDICSVGDCGEVAAEIDHITPRCKGGLDNADNLQALCALHHSEKTRMDAPWTAGGIYAKSAQRRKQRIRDKLRGSPLEDEGGVAGELFPDTG